MARSAEVRRRKQKPRDAANDGDWSTVKSNDGTGTGICAQLTRGTVYATMVVVTYLFYAYFTSPTSSVAVRDFHDVVNLKWSHVRNSDLQKSKKVLLELTGPESVVVDSYGNWYTGLHDGRIVKITDGYAQTRSVEDITENVKYTGGERTKRRPMGLRLVKNRLYLADAYQGIFVIDIVEHTWRKIVGYKDVHPPISFTNDLVLSKDEETIYFTDTSTRWQCHEVAYSLIEGECTGRLFKVDVKSGEIGQMRENLCFPNGIQLNPEETMLLVSENTRARISVIEIASGDAAQTIHLPGGADNIRSAKNGGYWVPIPALHDPALGLTFNYPFIRDIVAKILGADGVMNVIAKQGTVVRLNEKFEPVSIHFDLDGKVCQVISEVQEYGEGKFLLGSLTASGIAHIEGLDSE